MTRNASAGRRGAGTRRSKCGRPGGGPGAEDGFSLIEVVIALVVLAGMMAATTSLVINALHVGQASRLRLVATEIASDQLDCAVASLNVTVFPTQCGEPQSLLSAMGYSGLGGVDAIPSVTGKVPGITFTIEQQVQPGNQTCGVPSGGAPPELLVTDWVTWSSPNTPASEWYLNSSLASQYVQQSTLVAVPATALNPADGSILVKLTDDALNGQPGVTVNVYSGGPPATGTAVASAISSGGGCALFVNLAPGLYTVSAAVSGGIDSNNDMSAGSPAPLSGVGMSGNVVAAGTLTLPASAPLYYAQSTAVSVNWAAPPAPYAEPTSGLTSVPISFYDTGLVTSPSVVAFPAPSVPVFPFLHSAPSYYVVGGGCGANSIPDGSATADGVALPASGSLSPGGTATATLGLTGVTAVAQDATGERSGAAVTAIASTPKGAAPTCPLTTPTLQLGNTAAAVVQPPGGSTTTIVNSNAYPSVSGQNVTFTATVAPVTPSSVLPTGTVTFTMDGGAICAGGVALSASTASCTVSALTGASHNIIASYSGDSNFQASTSVVYTQAVGSTQNATTTAVTSTADPSVSGQSVGFTATVSPTAPAWGVPTGTVTFTMDGSPICAGGVALSAGAATCTVANVTGTPHHVTATYLGDGNFSGSVSGSYTQTVGATQDSSAVSVTSNINPSVSGTGVTFTATVGPGGSATGVPSGQVQFKDGGTNLGPLVTLSGGVASYTDPALTGPPSSQSITAVYSGDGNFKTSTSAAYTQSVVVDDLLSSLPYGYYLLGSTLGAESSTNATTATVVDVATAGVTVYSCSGGSFSGGYYSGATACAAQTSALAFVTMQ